MLSPKRSTIKPIVLSPNPRSRTIIQDFLDSGLTVAEVDTSWSTHPRRVYEKLHKFLKINGDLGIGVRMETGKILLYQIDDTTSE
ncbi:MAG: hypothetical protein D4S01_08445 [Dehalococcoidia bacterium]|nr:MAG: hypothetical protein D4S01_08445 [Dehalococcoidia bacterium]